MPATLQSLEQRIIELERIVDRIASKLTTAVSVNQINQITASRNEAVVDLNERLTLVEQKLERFSNQP